MPLPPPLALWRRFQSMARVDRVMGDAASERFHQNRAGGEKNITINHGCGGCDCGSGSNSDSNSDGDGRGDGGSEALKITTTTAETAVAAAPE